MCFCVWWWTFYPDLPDRGTSEGKKTHKGRKGTKGKGDERGEGEGIRRVCTIDAMGRWKTSVCATNVTPRKGRNQEGGPPVPKLSKQVSTKKKREAMGAAERRTVGRNPS